MAEWANWWCGLFGYSSCQQLSTFESILLAGGTAIVGFLALMFVLGGLAALAGR
jgi:hypothetical protein